LPNTSGIDYRIDPGLKKNISGEFQTSLLEYEGF